MRVMWTNKSRDVIVERTKNQMDSYLMNHQEQQEKERKKERKKEKGGREGGCDLCNNLVDTSIDFNLQERGLPRAKQGIDGHHIHLDRCVRARACV